MAKLEQLGTVIDADILVIGGGSAALWAANRAKDYVDNVLIVDKGPLQWGGLISMSGGDFDAIIPPETVDDWMKDLVYYYDGLCQQDLMEEIFKRCYDRFQDYQRFGCEFKKTEDGKYYGIPQRGLSFIKLYPARYKGSGGEDMVRALINEGQRVGVRRMHRTTITDLINHNGRVVGAVGFNILSGRFFIFRTKAVILASGAASWKTSYLKNTSTGEGVYMAFRHGAEMRNCEFAKVWNVPKLFAWESQTTLLPLGARFVNASGEPFMDKYSPVLGANTDPHYNVLGMAFEAREGKSPIYFDISPIKPERFETLKPETGWQLMNYQKLCDVGIDFFKQNTEWMPQVSCSFAGLVADVRGRTNVPGLFVAGRARNVDPGLYIGGFALMTTAVTGHMVGRTVSEYVREQEFVELDWKEVKKCKDELYAPLGKEGIAPKEVLMAVQETMFPADVLIIKSEQSLTRALKRMDSINNELLPRMAARDHHYLAKSLEVRSIAFATELYVRASLMRKETRAGHFRQDYPTRDDNWLKWIVISQKDGKLNFRTEPVPMDKYRFKMERYYMDNFQFPGQPKVKR